MKRRCSFGSMVLQMRGMELLKYLGFGFLLFTFPDGTVLGQASKPAAQEAPANAQIKVKTELMEIRTVVTDRRGQFVENLKKEDFELLEDNKAQEISFFTVSKIENLSGETGETTAVPPAPRDKTDQPAQNLKAQLSKPPVRTILLYVDNLHMSFSAVNRVKESLRRFVRERITDQDLIALATSRGTLGIAEQFTRNRQILDYAIEQIRVGNIGSESFFTPALAAQVVKEDLEALRLAVSIMHHETAVPEDRVATVNEADQTREVTSDCRTLLALSRSRASQVLSEAASYRKTTLAILKGFAEQMADLPGKRMIVIFSDGFSLLDIDGDSHIEDLQPSVNKAVRSGVAVYSIDAKGLHVPPAIDAGRNLSSVQLGFTTPDDDNADPRCFPPASGTLEDFLNLSGKEEMSGLAAVANDTGGKLYENTNDLLGALGQAVDANRFYYVLSYYLQPGRDPGRFRNLKVRVRNHPEYSVRTVRGFLPADLFAKKVDDTAKTPQQRLLRAMASPLAATDLGVSAEADYLETADDDKQVLLTVYVDGENLRYVEKDQRKGVGLEILYAIQDSTGKQVDIQSAHVEGSLTSDRVEQAKAAGYRFSRRLTLKPGAYQARIGVREEGTDRMGTASAWIEVPEPVRERLQVSSLVLRSLFDTDPAAMEGMNVSEFEQVRMVQGIPLYARGDVCDYFLRINRGTQPATGSELLLMKELFRAGKSVLQENWRQITSEEKDSQDSKGWFDVDGEVDLKEFDPGIYELRISVKDARSGKTVQRSAIFGVD